MKRLTWKPPARILATGVALLVLAMSAVTADAINTVRYAHTINPPAPKSFDISFTDNSTGNYILASRSDNALDLFNAGTDSFTGYIGKGGFVGTGPATCGVPHACAGPNGTLIDAAGHAWAGDGPASACSGSANATPACRCFAGQTTSMVKEYTVAPSTGTTGRLACIDTHGIYRSDEMAYGAGYVLVANDGDGFLTLINTSTATISDVYCYTDNDVPTYCASHRGTQATAGGGIEQPVYDPSTGYFYQAIPQGTSTGRIDVFNPAGGTLTFLGSITAALCTGGPTGLALAPANGTVTTDQLLGACSNGADLFYISGSSGTEQGIQGTAATTGGADEIWYDPGTNTWYLGISNPRHLGAVNAGTYNVQTANCNGQACGGHSVTAYSHNHHVFEPDAGPTGSTAPAPGIRVFDANWP